MSDETKIGGPYLGRRVYVEAFGRKRYGVVCSVYLDDTRVTCEVEWCDGGMDSRSFPSLKFAEPEDNIG